VPTASSNVRYQGQPGRHLLAMGSSQFDPERTSRLLWPRCRNQNISNGQIG
jgi:hypothetical protein